VPHVSAFDGPVQGQGDAPKSLCVHGLADSSEPKLRLLGARD
jgi:hypothetical protein